MTTTPRVVAIVQARLGSTRLPGKVFLDLAGRSMLERVIDRLERASSLSRIVVATTVEPRDDLLAEYVQAHDWMVYRGSELDVLDRYHGAARQVEADVIVRITSDCPLIDPEIIDALVQWYLRLEDEWAYVSNTQPKRTYPRGLDAEVFGCQALEIAWQEERDLSGREHVTPYLYRHPERFHVHNMILDHDLSHHRWTVDTPEDLALMRKLYNQFGSRRFGWRDVLQLLDEHPDWAAMNAHVMQKSH